MVSVLGRSAAGGHGPAEGIGFAHARPSAYSAPMEKARQTLRALLAAAYLLAGTLHILHPAPFLSITPAWVPYAHQVIFLTGLCEVAGALALLVPRLRRSAGIMLAAYAVCVYPANVKHAVDYVTHGTGGLSLWYHVPRLAFQPAIVWWALFAGHAIDWPFQRRSARA